ncbi:hypothetical protein EMCRGX_G009798 [Ephydatia muelleri]
MPLHVMANFGGFLCECGLEGYVSLLIMLCYFGDAFVMQYISPINLLKASLVYVRGDRCLKDYGFLLSQAVDSAEVSYAMALLPSFCFSAAFRFELVEN